MKYCLIVFTMLFAHCVKAQVTDSVYFEGTSDYVNESATVNPRNITKQSGYDEEPIKIQRFDPAKWKKVIGTENFEDLQSKEQKPKEAPDSTNANKAGNRRLNKSENSDAEESSTTTFSSPLLTVLVYAAAFGIIAYILYLILQNASWKSNPKIRKVDLQNDVSSPVLEIKELEIDRLLREAMAATNYRLAIRICYLGLLKKLDEDGFIIWKKDKTNRDYLTELYLKARYYEEVRQLTSVYELVWYGDHDLEVQSYEEIISSFKAINQKLNTSNAQ
jgi:hypothetical protein